MAEDEDELARLRAENARLRLEVAKLHHELKRQQHPIDPLIEGGRLREWALSIGCVAISIDGSPIPPTATDHPDLCRQRIQTCVNGLATEGGWVWAWRGYAVSRTANLPLHPALRSYFDAVAARVAVLDEMRPPPRDLARAAGNAVQIDGGRQSSAGAASPASNAAHEVCMAYEEGRGSKVSLEVEWAAKRWGVSPTTVYGELRDGWASAWWQHLMKRKLQATPKPRAPKRRCKSTPQP